MESDEGPVSMPAFLLTVLFLMNLQILPVWAEGQGGSEVCRWSMDWEMQVLVLGMQLDLDIC